MPASPRSRPKPARVVPPLQFPTSGFTLIDPGDKFEEERLPAYKRDSYYPMRIGDILKDRYQVVAKLGYGVTSTVWLCRDLCSHEKKYWALKVHIHNMTHNQELVVFRHLAGVERDTAGEEEHPGVEHIRQLEDSFTIQGPTGEEHTVFVLQPLGMSWRSLQDLQPSRVFALHLVVSALNQTLLGLNFLHEVADVVHADLHADNLLIALADESILAGLEDDEMNTPSARKPVAGTAAFIHNSKYMLGGMGPLTICDFGQARIGPQHTGLAMPKPYRAPEVILKMPWGKYADMWSVGLMAWDMLEPKSLFDVYDAEPPERNDAMHLAAMTAVLGRPPQEFLQLSSETAKYWDSEGEWIGPVPLPDLEHISMQITRFQASESTIFMSFIGGLLSWIPHRRLGSAEAYQHPWLEDFREDSARMEQERGVS